MLQRREHIGDIGQAVLWPGLSADRQAVGALAACDLGLPFAVAPVEHQNGVAGGEPQHVAEIVALVPLEYDRLAGAQGGVDEQPRRAKVDLQAW